MMDGSGQFPLHQAVKQSYTGLVKIMLAHDPALLHRENAMGRTPLELAESLYVRVIVKGNPDIRTCRYSPLALRNCEDFVEPFSSGDDGLEDWVTEETAIRLTLDVCRDSATKEPRARKLVSVSEAREVVKRLAERNKVRNNESQEDTKEVVKDEVDTWLGNDPFTMD